MKKQICSQIKFVYIYHVYCVILFYFNNILQRVLVISLENAVLICEANLTLFTDRKRP